MPSRRKCHVLKIQRSATLTVSIDDQVACVRRELGFRRRVYARRVSEGKMTQISADKEITAMEAVLVTVEAAAAKTRLF